MINTLTLNTVKSDARLGRSFQVLVDDVPLLDLFSEYESQFCTTINGAYIDVLSEHSVRTALQTIGQRFMPLGCDCGVEECWFVSGEVLTLDQYVCWGRWLNPYRNNKARANDGLYWSYKEFPAIVFETKQYHHAIEQALKLS